MGRNGVGKTTLLVPLSATKPTQGKLLWQNEEISYLGAERACKGMAFVPQARKFPTPDGCWRIWRTGIFQYCCGNATFRMKSSNCFRVGRKCWGVAEGPVGRAATAASPARALVMPLTAGVDEPTEGILAPVIRISSVSSPCCVIGVTWLLCWSSSILIFARTGRS